MRFLRPGSVEGVSIGSQDPLELLLLQDEQVIEALATHTAQEALTDGIGSRGLVRRCENLDATGLGNPCERHTKLAIVITDEGIVNLIPVVELIEEKTTQKWGLSPYFSAQSPLSHRSNCRSVVKAHQRYGLS
jgi:hypothetical protein